MPLEEQHQILYIPSKRRERGKRRSHPFHFEKRQNTQIKTIGTSGSRGTSFIYLSKKLIRNKVFAFATKLTKLFFNEIT